MARKNESALPSRPSPKADPQFIRAFAEIAARIAKELPSSGASHPLRMYVAGGAAVHYYTGARTTRDVDAVFSRKLLLPEDLDINYVDATGRSRLLYFDRQYNDTFGLLHEDANNDSRSIALLGVDPRKLDVRLLSPVDLAVSKISRLEDHDQDDIESLTRAGLIIEREVRARAEEALKGYVGNARRVRTSLEIACQLIASVEAEAPRRQPPKPRR